MFGIGSTELVIIIIVALIVVGPSKLPQLMRSVGKGLSELRNVGSDVKSTLEREVERADQDTRRQKAKQDLDRKAEEEAAQDDLEVEDETATAAAEDNEAAEPAGPPEADDADEKPAEQSKGSA